MKKKLLLIDFNNLLFRSVFAHKTLTHKGTFTGGIFGAIDMVASIVNRYGCDRVVVCHDTKPYHREEYYEAYKADRKKEDRFDEEDLKRIAVSRAYMQDFFKLLRFPQAATVGYEADDFIGNFCKNSDSKYGQIFIMSNDSDFYQLLAPRVFLCKSKGLYGRKDFSEEFPGIKPKDWPRCIALKGSHNGVPGIKGVGDVTAYKAVLEKMTDREVFKRWRVRRSDIKKRTDLATLPFPNSPEPPKVKILAIRYDMAKFEKLLDGHGITFKNEFHEAFLRLAPQK